MTILGYKGGKGGGGSNSPVEAKDTLTSTAYARVLDLVSEGEIIGLVGDRKGIFLDGTPLQNSDGSENFKGVTTDWRWGTQDQTYISGFPAVENTIAVNVELTSDAPIVRSVTNLDLNAIRVTFYLPALSKADTSNGNIGGYKIDYKIELSTDAGPFNTIVSDSFNGKTTGGYERSTRIDLPHATSGWQLRITRLTANQHSATIADTVKLEAVTEIIDSKMRYPNSAVIGAQCDASQFSSVPTRAYRLRGRIVQVPSNYDPDARTYAGVWDGTFKPAYSNNPAWVYYDILTNKRFGLGNRINSALIDKWSLYAIARYCDGLVSDGKGGQEPRFLCNVFLQQQADALKVLQDLAAVFRGISFWAGGSIVTGADMPADPVYTYTNANVLDGKFNYQGTALSTRYTVALVSWNDPTNMYKQAVEYVEDSDGIARYGIRQTQVVAIGCTSQSQANRYGRWILDTSRLCTETLTFGVGLDGTLAAPGQIIRIADATRAGKRIGGRIASATSTSITVDALPDAAAGDTLTVTLPTGVVQSVRIAGVDAVNCVITSAVPFTAIPVVGSTWAVESTTLTAPTYRVVGVAENSPTTFTITALRHVRGIFDNVDNGTAITDQPITVLNPSVQPPASNVTITSNTEIQQDIAITTMTIAWEVAPGAQEYRVEYQRENDNWVYAGTTAGKQFDVRDIIAGTYVARVTAISPIGISSVPALSDPTVLSGKPAPPPAVAALTTTGRNLGIDVHWAFSTTVNVKDTRTTEIWYCPGSGYRVALKGGDGTSPQKQMLMSGATITTGGGAPPYTFSVASGALPTGLALSTDGVISGSATVDGIYYFVIAAKDAQNRTGTQAYAVTVNRSGAQPIFISPSGFDNAKVGTAFSATLSADGGKAPYGFAVTSGALPPGLTLSVGGVLSGTPTIAGVYNFAVTATDANGAPTRPQGYALTVLPASGAGNVIISPTALPNGNAGVARQNATKLADVPYPGAMTTLAGIPANTTYLFWARLVDKSDKASDWYPQGAGIAGTSLAIQKDGLDPVLINQIDSGPINSLDVGQFNANIDARVNAAKQTIDNEITALGANLQPQIDSTRMLVGTVQASVDTETQQRTEGDTQLGSRIDTVKVANDANAAAITQETTARTTADSALAERVDELTAIAGPNTAAIQQEAQARASGDAANAQLVSNLEATFAPTLWSSGKLFSDPAIKAGINNRADVQASKDEALAQQISTQQVQLDANSASIQSEATTRATRDAALSTRVDAVVASTGDNTAAILTETIARTTANNAMASRIDLLTASVGDAQSNIFNEQTARASADSAMAQQLTTITASVNSNAAAIQAEQTARANADSAEATARTALKATVDGQIATITQQATVIAGLTTGPSALWGVKLDVNGYVTGFATYNDGKTGRFDIIADQFRIVSPGSTAVAPFVVDGGNIYMNANVQVRGTLTADRIVSGTVGGGTIINYGNGAASVFDNGTTMQVYGNGFGANNDLLEWFGPSMPIGQCTTSNGTTYKTTNGAIYTKSTVTAGTLYNANSSTSTDSAAFVTIGPFGTNGGPKTITCSYSFNHSDPSGAGNWTQSISAQVDIYRSVGGGSETKINTLYVNGTERASPGDGQSGKMNGSISFVDNTGGTSTFRYRAALAARNIVSAAGTVRQTITLSSQEG